MDFKSSLAEFKEKIDKEIESFLDAKISNISQQDKWVAEGMKYIKDLMLFGGKRIRPALMYWGYKAVGGKDEKKILKACVGVELVHIFLLIHDDIIDRSDRRHGMETVNIWGERKGRKMFETGDIRRFGYSMATIFGDMTSAWANQAIMEAGFDPKSTISALNYLQEVISTTIVGQSQDITIEYKLEAKEGEILEMYKNKTARYTFEGPLCLGGILAGIKKDDLGFFSEFGIPVGTSFQIQDDILGIFGSEDKLGKSTASDITEGKKTILTAKVFADASILQQERLQYILGRQDISSEDIGEFQEIIMDSGSLKYARKKAEDLAAQGKQSIEKSKISQEAKDFLIGAADYIIKREI
jgi:geranylgeranyl diphosphate synthase, type I